MRKEHRKKKKMNKFKRPGEEGVRSEKERVMWIKTMGGKGDAVTEKRGRKEHRSVHKIWCAHLFRNTFKLSKMWSALKTANPRITSSVLMYPSSSCRMKNWEDLYHSQVNILSHSRFLSYWKNSHPIYSSFFILSSWNTSSSHMYLRDWDPQRAVCRSLLSFSSFWILWLQEIRVAGEAAFYL